MLVFGVCSLNLTICQLKLDVCQFELIYQLFDRRFWNDPCFGQSHVPTTLDRSENGNDFFGGDLFVIDEADFEVSLELGYLEVAHFTIFFDEKKYSL